MMGKPMTIDKTNGAGKQKRVTVSFKENPEDIEIYNWLVNHPKAKMLGMSGITKLALLKAMEQHLLED